MTLFCRYFCIAENANVAAISVINFFSIHLQHQITATGNIDKQHDCQFPLFLKNFDIRFMMAGCYIQSISRTSSQTDIPRTGKRPYLSFKNRMVLPQRYYGIVPASLFRSGGLFFNNSVVSIRYNSRNILI